MIPTVDRTHAIRNMYAKGEHFNYPGNLDCDRSTIYSNQHSAPFLPC